MTTPAGETATVTRDALTVLQPGFVGTTPPDWLLRRLGEGLGGVALFGRNIDSPGQLAALTARLRAVRARRAGRHRRGGRRRHPAGGARRLLLPRQPRARRRRRPGADPRGGRANSAAGSPPAGSTSTGRRPPTSTPTRTTRSSACAPSAPTRTWSPGTPPPTCAGLQSAGVAACVKHFPGHGDTAVDSHLALPRIDADLATLRARELVPFRAAVAAGARV